MKSAGRLSIEPRDAAIQSRSPLAATSLRAFPLVLVFALALGILVSVQASAQPALESDRTSSAPIEARSAARASDPAGKDPELDRAVDANPVVSFFRDRPDLAQARLQALPQERGQVDLLRERAVRELGTLELRLQNASSRYTALPSPTSALLDEVETLQFERDAKAQQIAALEDRLARFDAQEILWRRALAIRADRTTATQTGEWYDDAVLAASRLERAFIQRRGRIEDLEASHAAIRSRLANGDVSGAARVSLESRQHVIEDLIAFLREDASGLETAVESERAFADELKSRLDAAPILERVRIFLGRVVDLWGYEITSVDGDPITIGNALLALLMVGLGLSVSKRISHALRSVFEKRFHVDPGVAAALETAAFYVFVVSFGLVALRTVNFPLTAFTVAGGALAIGIGFGSQNVMNNFISGLILMLERPIRGQDVVEMEGTHGVVERIGARSTRIRATDGRHVIVPNSFLLESNVVNWTLSDDLFRAKIVVGVVYGSPTRLVEKLIRQALDENAKILASPEPIINFSDFGNDALIFEAYFWLKARGPMVVEIVKSETRFRIDDLFREHDLIIAFPQRDVHLDSVRPIEIRVVGSEPRSLVGEAPKS